MPQYYFDWLPLDVLKHHIFPHLNYTERNTLNDLTTTHNRIRTKIPRDKIAQFEMTLATITLGPILLKIEILRGQERQEAILSLYKNTLPKCLVLCRHNAGFRGVLIEKLVKYLDLDNSDFINCSDAFKSEFNAVNCTLLDLLNTRYEFRYHLGSINYPDTWSSVDAGPHHIIEVWTPHKPKPKPKQEQEPSKRRAIKRYNRNRSRSPNNVREFDNWCDRRMKGIKTTKN